MANKQFIHVCQSTQEVRIHFTTPGRPAKVPPPAPRASGDCRSSQGGHDQAGAQDAQGSGASKDGGHDGGRAQDGGPCTTVAQLSLLPPSSSVAKACSAATTQTSKLQEVLCRVCGCSQGLSANVFSNCPTHRSILLQAIHFSKGAQNANGGGSQPFCVCPLSTPHSLVPSAWL